MKREFIGKTAYITRGCGKPVVLIHGVGMNADFWTPQLECLSQHWRAIAIDILGHGESAPPPQHATFADYREQTNNVLDSVTIMGCNTGRTFFGRFGGDCRGAFPTAKGELFGRPKCGVSAKRFGKKGGVGARRVGGTK